jgi:hypothetical protein
MPVLAHNLQVLLPKGAGSFVSNPIFEYRVKFDFCYVTYRATAVL